MLMRQTVALCHRWYRSHMDLLSLTLLSQTSLVMPREGDARRLSVDVFAATYDRPCLPVVLERAMEGWNGENGLMTCVGSSPAFPVS